MKEQYACFKFCVKLTKKGTEIFSMFKAAFGEQTVGRSFLGGFQSSKAVWHMLKSDTHARYFGIHGVVCNERVTQGQTVNHHSNIDTNCVCVKICCVSYLKNGNQGVGLSTIMMHLLHLHRLCVNFCVITKWLIPQTRFISFSAAFLPSFPKIQEGIKGSDISQRDYFEEDSIDQKAFSLWRNKFSL